MVSVLNLDQSFKAILFNEDGCPYLNNIDLMFSQFPKIDYSTIHTIVFTKSPSVCVNPPQPVMEVKAKPEIIRITKASTLYPMDIKFEIDLSNTVTVLKYRVF